MLVVTSLQIIATVALLAGLDDAVAAQAGLHGWMRVVGELVFEAVAHSVCLLL